MAAAAAAAVRLTTVEGGRARSVLSSMRTASTWRVLCAVHQETGDFGRVAYNLVLRLKIRRGIPGRPARALVLVVLHGGC